LESAEACVTTHLPKQAAPKKDDAKACALSHLYHTVAAVQQGGIARYWTDWVRNV